MDYTKARVRVILDHPFFGSLLMKLPLVEDPGCDTLYTDGTKIGVNPEFAKELPPDELCGVLCHEIMHVALGHHKRRGDRDPKRWNVACDYAINPILEKDGVSLPADALLDPNYEDLSAEEIYARLPEPDPSDEPSGGQGESGEQDGPPGEVRDLPDGAEEAVDEIDVRQATQAAKLAGKGGDAASRAVSNALTPKVDWREVLRQFIQQSRDDYSWSRPNRRFIGQGLYLPGADGEELGELVVAVDTSGSVDVDMLDQFISEVSAIALESRPSRVHVLYCDTEVEGHDVFERDEPVTANPKGGGGTLFQPVFDAVAQEGITPECLIYLTDLYGPAPDDPGYPVLWICDSQKTAPFGETIHI